MEQLSQSPFFPVPVRWFEIPVQTARWGLGQLAQSNATESSAASLDSSAPAESAVAATSTDATVAPESEMTSADTSAESTGSTVGVILNEYA